MKYILFILLSLSFIARAQVVNNAGTKPQTQKKDTLVIDSGKKDSLKIFKPTINDYLYQTQFSEKKVFDTVMTFDKTYIFSQQNNKDNFGRIQPANIGSGFNPCIRDKSGRKPFPIAFQQIVYDYWSKRCEIL